MRLRTIVGTDVKDALERVQEQLGAQALVLETRTTAAGTEIVAAEVEREEPAEGVMRLRAELALLRKELASFRDGAAGTSGPSASSASAKTVHAVEPAQRVEPVVRAAPPSSRIAERLALVAQRLGEQGLSPDLLERVLDIASRAPADEGSPLDPARSDYCLNAVAGLLPGLGPKAAHTARCYAFVGPGGSGKTTTIAKLATARARSGDRSFGIVTLDGERPGGSEVLERTADRIKVPFARVRGAQDLTLALDELGGDRGPRMILVDTAGTGPRETAALGALKEKLRLPGRVAVHLVLPANLEEQSMCAAGARFRDFAPSSLVFTKVDETHRLGALVNLPAAMELPVVAIGHGESVESDLAPATRRLIAEIVLGRRPRSVSTRKARAKTTTSGGRGR